MNGRKGKVQGTIHRHTRGDSAHHHGVVALAGLEGDQLSVEVLRALSGQFRPGRIDAAVAAGTVAGAADRRLRGASRSIAFDEWISGRCPFGKQRQWQGQDKGGQGLKLTVSAQAP